MHHDQCSQDSMDPLAPEARRQPLTMSPRAARIFTFETRRFCSAAPALVGSCAPKFVAGLQVCTVPSGVSQISWSTPGVFLPWFSVTRRTARTLPLYEWVSRRCKARTLPHLLAFVACTIRTWSRRTLRLMACQSRPYHSAASRETAPTACAVVICLASYADLPSSLV